ncbi:MAG: Lsr2 family protein [Pseudonocardiales bacterium]
MAQQVKVILVDDIEGGSAEETLSFALDGATYEIDLSTANAAKFRDAVAPYVAAARKAGRSGSRGNGVRAPRRGTAGDRRGRAADIRAWARTKGVEVSERGRIPARVVEQYDAAH